MQCRTVRIGRQGFSSFSIIKLYKKIQKETKTLLMHGRNKIVRSMALSFIIE